MIELLIGGGFIVDLTILSKKQRDLLDTLKKSVLFNSSFYLAGGTGLGSIFSESIALKALTYFKDAEDENIDLKLKDDISWEDIKSFFITICLKYLH